MNILQLCHKPPFPPVDGGAIAMNNITQGLLQEGHQVKVLSICTPKHFVKEGSLPLDYIKATGFECSFIDTSISVKNAFFNLFTTKSYNIERFICQKFADKIQQNLLENPFDVVILESLFVAPYIDVLKKYSKAKIVLRAHNVEFLIWERMSQNSRNPIKKLYLKILSKRLKKFEILSLSKVDAVCTMTHIDQASIRKIAPNTLCSTIPSGYQTKDMIPSGIKEEKNTLFHLASMDWQPNVEAVNWFLEKVWPTVSTQNPTSKLYLAGREMPERYYQLNSKKLIVVGQVDSAKEFFESKQIMLVPLLSGSGMRIKIIEGMAIGKVIISTSIGAEGINCEHGKNILIADTPEEFIECINKCLKDENFCQAISANAVDLIKNEYSNEIISKKLTTFFQSL